MTVLLMGVSGMLWHASAIAGLKQEALALQQVRSQGAWATNQVQNNTRPVANGELEGIQAR